MASEVQTSYVQLVGGVPTMVSATYRHEQASGDTTWTVTHNLGLKYCSVQVVDENDDEIFADSVSFDSTTQLTLTFSQNQTGVAVVTR